MGSGTHTKNIRTGLKLKEKKRQFGLTEESNIWICLDQQTI